MTELDTKKLTLSEVSDKLEAVGKLDRRDFYDLCKKEVVSETQYIAQLLGEPKEKSQRNKSQTLLDTISATLSEITGVQSTSTDYKNRPVKRIYLDGKSMMVRGRPTGYQEEDEKVKDTDFADARAALDRARIQYKIDSVEVDLGGFSAYSNGRDNYFPEGSTRITLAIDLTQKDLLPKLVTALVAKRLQHFQPETMGEKQVEDMMRRGTPAAEQKVIGDLLEKEPVRQAGVS